MTELARGTYRYWRDGAIQPIVEPWSLRRNLHGALCLRGYRQSEAAPLLDVEADYRGGDCTGLRVRWHPPAPAEVRTVHYRHESDRLDWRFGDDSQFQVQALPVETRLFPLLRAATGPLLPLLASGRSVVLPDLRHPAAGSPPFLQPLLSDRRSELLGEDIEGLRHWRYYGGEYGVAGCDCWTNRLGLLQRYRWESPHGLWEVRLEDFQSADGFTGFEA